MAGFELRIDGNWGNRFANSVLATATVFLDL